MNKLLTESDVDALQTSGLHQRTPYAIRGVSTGYFSIARHYGGATYNGDHYTYCPVDDTLVRDDVLKWLNRRKSEERKSKKKKTAAMQPSFPEPPK